MCARASLADFVSHKIRPWMRFYYALKSHAIRPCARRSDRITQRTGGLGGGWGGGRGDGWGRRSGRRLEGRSGGRSGGGGGEHVVGADVLGGPPPARVWPRQARPSRVAGAAATSAALPCGVRGISLRNGRGGRVATYRRAKAPRQGSAGPSSAGLRFVRWSSVRPLAFGRRARTRSKRGCRPRRTARPCRSRSRRPSP